MSNKTVAKDRRRIGAFLHHLQDGKCFLCKKEIGTIDSWVGTHMHPEKPTLDHVNPRSKGGGNEETNYTLVHEKCNNSRGDSSLSPEEYRRHKQIASVILNVRMVKRMARISTTASSPPPQS